MSIVNGKKYIVISPEEYDILKQPRRVEEKQPERNDMEKSNNEMKNIWNRADIASDEKVRIFTEELNNFKNRYNE